MPSMSKIKMEAKKKMAILILNHLISEIKTDDFNEESIESLDIAIQCIKSTYNVNPTEIENVDEKLEDMIQKYCPDVRVMLNIKSDVTEEGVADYHNEIGYEFLKEHNHEKAIEYFSIAISLNPTKAMFYSDRASAYNSYGKYNEAINDCQKAIELDATCSSAYDRIGLAYSHLKDFCKALPYFEKACELSPQNGCYQFDYQSALSYLQATLPTQQSQSHNSSDFVPTPTNNPEVFAGLNYVVAKMSTNEELIKFMQFVELVFTYLVIIDPDLLEGLLQMHFQSVFQNERQTTPDIDPVEDNPSNTKLEI